MDTLSKLCKIENPPDNPINLFQKCLNNYRKYKSPNVITMNIATVNEKYSILNRTVLYRGLIDDCIAFVTERNTQKYKDIQNNQKVAVTLLFIYKNDEQNIIEQVRVNGKAVELSNDQIKEFWDKDPIYAKIRSKICECGKPIDWDDLKKRHDEILKDYEEGHEKLDKPDTYTAFKIIPELIDFYYSAGQNAIADRVRYTRNTDKTSWTHTHVCT